MSFLHPNSDETRERPHKRKEVRHMTANDILQAWIEYSGYDPEKHSFNLMNGEYHFHSASRNAAAMRDFDPTGSLAVLYLKEMYRRFCAEAKFTLKDFLEDPHGLDETKRMWDLFRSPDMENIENGILEALEGLIRRIVPVKQIGERDRDAERAALADSITGVAEELNKCNVEFFLKAGDMGQIKTFSTEIHVFDTLSQCLLTLETAPDSLYLAYIRNGDTSDGYFGFFIKSNGNLLSINERVSERYPGQHSKSRNGRWSESKAYQIFPYALMKDIGERDYLGYAHHYRLDDSDLKLFNLGPSGYMPLVLAMVMISVKYSGCATEEYPLFFVDTLLPHNLALAQASEETALIVPENSALVAAAKGYVNEISTAGVLSGSLSSQFDHQALRDAGIQKHYAAQGSFPQSENIFVKLYGEGFKLNTDSLLERNRHMRLPSNMDILIGHNTPDFEFVGDKDRLDLIAYRTARMQLADYIRDQMFKEYTSFGGKEAVRAWFNEQIEAHKSELFEICIGALDEAEKNGEDLDQENKRCFETAVRSSGYRVLVQREKSGVRGYGRRPFNKRLATNIRKTSCVMDPTVKATYDFQIEFRDWEDMAKLFGEENVPKILIGYNENGHRTPGNSILDCVDYVSGIGTPFEREEYESNPRYWTANEWSSYYWRHHEQYPDWAKKKPPEGTPQYDSKLDFYVQIAFSKRGINQLRKQAKAKEQGHG